MRVRRYFSCFEGRYTTSSIVTAMLLASGCSIIVGNPDSKIGGSGSSGKNSAGEPYVLNEQTNRLAVPDSGFFMLCSVPTVASSEKPESVLGCDLQSSTGESIAEGTEFRYKFETTRATDLYVSRLPANELWPMIFSIRGQDPVSVNKFTKNLDFSIQSFDGEKAPITNAEVTRTGTEGTSQEPPKTRNNDIGPEIRIGKYFDQDEEIEFQTTSITEASVSLWFKRDRRLEAGNQFFKVTVCFYDDNCRTNHSQLEFYVNNKAVMSRVTIEREAQSEPMEYIRSTNQQSDKKWHHVGYVLDTNRNNIVVYFDGEQIYSLNLRLPPTAAENLRVLVTDMEGFFLDDISIFSEVLSGEEMSKLANGQTPQAIPTSTDSMDQ